MPLADRGAGARGADRERGGDDAVLAEPAEDLAGLAGDLLLLARDVRDDVVEHVEREHARRPARARHALHGGHQDPLHAEAIEQGPERHHQPHRRAVRQGRD